MSKFEKFEWKRDESAQEFIDNADYYILERYRLFEIMKSQYNHFFKAQY